MAGYSREALGHPDQAAQIENLLSAPVQNTLHDERSLLVEVSIMSLLIPIPKLRSSCKECILSIQRAVILRDAGYARS